MAKLSLRSGRCSAVQGVVADRLHRGTLAGLGAGWCTFAVAIIDLPPPRERERVRMRVRATTALFRDPAARPSAPVHASLSPRPR